MDDYMHWEPSEYGRIRKLVVPPSRIWLPDFVIGNRSAVGPNCDICDAYTVNPSRTAAIV